ncbi:response regulator transcription factor [Asticcacaulis sp. AC402]|uniref:response regulator transcription factor n=1 Tax=Asticcacaulis sp. AC402 TaxID=1282361 RepID=UPI0003F93C43|nr:response regulator [Asticcacaulis sp. AC402]
MVDDDCIIRDVLRDFLEGEGLSVVEYGTGEAFLSDYTSVGNACLLLDSRLPGMNGLELLQDFRSSGHTIPVIMITGHGDVTMAVEAMKAGAWDFLEKPVTRRRLIACVETAVKASRRRATFETEHRSAVERIARLTPRQSDIMAMIMSGHPNKNIAADLGISQRTVENHRASIMKKLQARSLPDLVRIATSGIADPSNPHM